MEKELTSNRREKLEHSLYVVDTMLCNCCGNIIATKKPGTLFDIFDCGWECKECGAYWLSSDGWEEQENYLIPFRNGAWFDR